MRVPPPVAQGAQRTGRERLRLRARRSRASPRSWAECPRRRSDLLDPGVEVLVATPGCLWDILEDVHARVYNHGGSPAVCPWTALTHDDKRAKQTRGLKFLVVAEADRMVEAGHFEELEHILRLSFRRSNDETFETEFEDPAHTKTKRITPGGEMHTFVFFATLSKDLQRNVTKCTPAIRGQEGERPHDAGRPAPPPRLLRSRAGGH